MILTPLKLVGRLAQSFMETIFQDSSHTGQVIHIKELGVTICYAQALSKPIIELRLGQPSLQHHPTMGVNMISAF
nr:carboxyl-terminal peptidase, putative (DUF239) [Ipomoea batatas]